MSWLSLTNNDSNIGWEWTMTYFGLFSDFGEYDAWNVDPRGNVESGYLNIKCAVRPSFYLASDVELEGEGTKTNPYRIKNLEPER